MVGTHAANPYRNRCCWDYLLTHLVCLRATPWIRTIQRSVPSPLDLYGLLHTTISLRAGNAGAAVRVAGWVLPPYSCWVGISAD